VVQAEENQVKDVMLECESLLNKKQSLYNL
jgi:hypothetical protein